jgi:Protein of unknown function (DUF3168)
MAAEAQIVTLLKADPAVAALVGTRIYAMPAPQNAESPFLTYQIVSLVRTGRAYNGKTVHGITGLQIDCWIDAVAVSSPISRYAKVLSIADAVRDALDGQGLVGDDTIDIIFWEGWSDLSTPEQTRRTLEFGMSVRSQP